MEKNNENLISPVKRLKSAVKRLEDSNVSIHNQVSMHTKNIRMYEPTCSLDYMIRMKEILIPYVYDYISDFLMNEYIRWNYDSYVFINTGTGTGKTTFVEKLVDSGQFNILVLTNRKANRQQIVKHLQEKGCYGYGYMVKVTSYQDLEKNKEFTSDYLDLYDYIVCDESHYFLADSDFNSLTNLSLMKIMNTNRAVKIFMSATNQNIQIRIIDRLKKKCSGNEIQVAQKVWVYTMQKSATVIRNIIGFESFDRDLLEKIIVSKNKWLIFVKSMQQGREIYLKLYKELESKVIYLDRESADDGSIEQKETFNNLINNEQFHQKVLITTCLLDNGVNIKDPELSNIVCFDDDPVEIVQMIGRKRANKNSNDFFDLYLIKESKQSLSVSYGNAIAKKKKFISVKKDIEDYHELNSIHYLNTKEGVEYRNMSYYHPYSYSYCFNYLGYSKISTEIKNLNDLRLSDDPFDIKIKWVLDKIYGQILGRITTTVETNKEGFLDEISALIDVEFNYESKEDKKIYHQLLSSHFWNWFKKEKGERSDRPLSIDKMRDKFYYYDMPLNFVFQNGKIKLIKDKEVKEKEYEINE